MKFTQDYDPGFLNVQGFGQSATNPAAPIFFQSLGIVEDLSVYQSVYAAQSMFADVSIGVGKSVLSQSGFNVGVPTNFEQPVNVETITNTKRLFVADKEYRRQRIKCENGTFFALVEV